MRLPMFLFLARVCVRELCIELHMAYFWGYQEDMICFFIFEKCILPRIYKYSIINIHFFSYPLLLFYTLYSRSNIALSISVSLSVWQFVWIVWCSSTATFSLNCFFGCPFQFCHPQPLKLHPLQQEKTKKNRRRRGIQATRKEKPHSASIVGWQNGLSLLATSDFGRSDLAVDINLYNDASQSPK